MFVFTASIAAVFLVALTIYVALHQPWLGLNFSSSKVNSGLYVERVSPDGPSTGLTPGDVVEAVTQDSQRIKLEPFDAVTEPDTAESYDAFNRFFERQNVLASVLRSGPIVLSLADGRELVISPDPMRPLFDLPPDFWIMIAVSLLSMLVGAWTFGFRRDVFGVKILALSSIALILCILPSAIFITRELALDGAFFRILTAMNFIGASGFCALLLALFLVHPRRLVPMSVIGVSAVFYTAWILCEYFQLWFSGPALGRYLFISTVAILALGVAAVQFVASKNEPHTRAAIGWFGLGLAISIIIYVLFYAVPSLLGESPFVPQWLGYALGFLVYGGMVLSIVRYRLFDLEVWTFRVLFYVVGAIIWAIIDIALVSILALDRLPTLGIALALVALFYLPLRDVVAQRFLPRQHAGRLLFQEVVDVALTPTQKIRDTKWQALLQQVFDPLNLSIAGVEHKPLIIDDGTGLIAPGFGIVSSVQLSHAHGGRRLFSSRDLDLVSELCAVLEHAAESRDAYARGIAEERARIGRDMHDNIGAKLLSALHGKKPDSKNAMIRDALSDLRDIINNVSGASQTLDETLAELRLETAERLSTAGMSLTWSTDGATGTVTSPVVAHALRSILREGVSNAIRHAGAKMVRVEITQDANHLNLAVSDDGSGIVQNASGTHEGTGLDGIRDRLAVLGGQLEIVDNETGFTLKAEIPSFQRADV